VATINYLRTSRYIIPQIFCVKAVTFCQKTNNDKKLSQPSLCRSTAYFRVLPTSGNDATFFVKSSLFITASSDSPKNTITVNNKLAVKLKICAELSNFLHPKIKNTIIYGKYSMMQDFENMRNML